MRLPSHSRAASVATAAYCVLCRSFRGLDERARRGISLVPGWRHGRKVLAHTRQRGWSVSLRLRGRGLFLRPFPGSRLVPHKPHHLPDKEDNPRNPKPDDSRFVRAKSKSHQQNGDDGEKSPQKKIKMLRQQRLPLNPFYLQDFYLLDWLFLRIRWRLCWRHKPRHLA